MHRAESKSSLIDLEARARVTRGKLRQPERLNEKTYPKGGMRQSGLRYNANTKSEREIRRSLPASKEVIKVTVRPFTQKLDNLSEHPVKQIINKVLKYDASKAFDTAAHAQFNATYLRVYGLTASTVSLTSNGTPGGTTSAALAKAQVGHIVDAMKERNIPAYVQDDYYAIGHPTTFSAFKTELDAVYQYTTEGLKKIANGEIGRYHNCRFVEQTGIAKAGYTYTDWCFFFGADTVAEAIAVPEEVRGKIPTDYGRSQGVAWYYLGGFGLVHGAAATTVAQARICKWDSRV